MSAAAATFNHILERKLDALMQRTKDRPVASGRVTAKTGYIIGIIFLLLGFIALYIFVNPLCALLGAFNTAWYIWVYTPLKRVSVWAVFVGSLTGVIPFFMGVFGANPIQIMPINYFVGAYLLMWQIPHFILLAYKYADDYQKAGMASIVKTIPQPLVIIIYYVWMLACSLIILAFPTFGFLQHNFSSCIIVVFAFVVILLVIIGLLISRNEINYRVSFFATNLMQLAVMLTLIADKLV